ncbi:MAG: radical SAM protein [Candidatus Omnitrophota bacterium]|nr:MAG: radical SAM protein [Candidatus Omnitrophota bacterium]
MISDKDLYSQNKLLQHLERLLMWKREGFAHPIFIDLDLTNRCNNRCPLCVTSQNRDQTTMPFGLAKDVISQLKSMNVKAILLVGGGDPTCHPNLGEVIRFIKRKGLEVAINTNAYKISKDTIKTIVRCCAWVRISLDAGTPAIYKKTHAMNKKAFYQVVDNISNLVDEKRKRKRNIVLGATYLIGPHTIEGIYDAARLCKKIGLDKLRYRLFEPEIDGTEISLSKDERKKAAPVRPWSFTKKEKENMFNELKRCKEFEDEYFSFSYSEDRFEAVIKGKSRSCKRCHITHFITSITPDLKVYPCPYLKNIEKYCLGDLTKENFKEIWFSDKRKKTSEKINVERCFHSCKYEKQNELLHNIKKAMFHPNFL